MRYAIAVLSLFIFLAPLRAQQQTLLSLTDVDHGGFGGPVIKVSEVNGEPAFLVGGRGGWIIDHTFIIGGGGYALVSDIPAHGIGPFNQRFVQLGYGGLELELIIQSDKLLHLSGYVLLGGGAIGFRHSLGRQPDFNPPFGDDIHNRDAFYIVEPAVNANLNMTEWFRISGGLSYRYVRGVTSAASTNSDLSGPSVVITFRFGSF